MGEDATILTKVAQKLEMKVAKELKINNKETMLEHVKWAYQTYKDMTDDRKDKKNISCLKSYYGKCECVKTLGCNAVQGSTLMTNKDLKIGCDKCKGMPGRNKDYGVCKNTQELPKPHKTKEACEKAGKCEWCLLNFAAATQRRRRL